MPQQIRLDAAALDELMLVRDGFASLAQVDLPPFADGDEVVDLEGAVVGRFVGGEFDWETEDSRPFAGLYSAPRPAGRKVAVWVDQPASAASFAPQNAVLLVPTTPSHQLGHRAAGCLRSALSAAEVRPDLSVVAVPITADSPHRALVEQQLGITSSTSISEHESHAPTGVFVLLSGLSGSGKSTIARALREELVRTGSTVTLLDGDQVRRELSAGLGFSPADRDTNIRRIGWVGAEIVAHGGVVVACPIAPYDATRRAVREMVTSAGGRMVLVHVATSLEECERRDRKGLYAKARAGEIPDFTGISAPYETPADAELVIDTAQVPVADAVAQIVALIQPSGSQAAAWTGLSAGATLATSGASLEVDSETEPAR